MFNAKLQATTSYTRPKNFMHMKVKLFSVMFLKNVKQWWKSMPLFFLEFFFSTHAYLYKSAVWWKKCHWSKIMVIHVICWFKFFMGLSNSNRAVLQFLCIMNIWSTTQCQFIMCCQRLRNSTKSFVKNKKLKSEFLNLF